MILETLELTKRALVHPTYGINPYLRGLPLVAGHTRPPEIVRILAEHDDDEAASGNMIMDWPVIMITTDGPASRDAEKHLAQPRRLVVPLAFRYVSNAVMDAVRRRDTLYTLRALLRVLDQLTNEENEAVERSLNGVEFISKQELQLGIVGDIVPQGEDAQNPLIVAGALRIGALVQDQQPQGVTG